MFYILLSKTHRPILTLKKEAIPVYCCITLSYEASPWIKIIIKKQCKCIYYHWVTSDRLWPVLNCKCFRITCPGPTGPSDHVSGFYWRDLEWVLGLRSSPQMLSHSIEWYHTSHSISLQLNSQLPGLFAESILIPFWQHWVIAITLVD